MIIVAIHPQPSLEEAAAIEAALTRLAHGHEALARSPWTRQGAPVAYDYARNNYQPVTESTLKRDRVWGV